MEPEDQELIKRILDQYSWQMPHQNDMYAKAPLRSRDGKADLSDVDTRDLLNECYRRRAIEKFTYTQLADTLMVQHDPKFTPHVIDRIQRDVWDAVRENQKFFTDAVIINESHDYAMRAQKYVAEVYVCKHPTKVRK